MCVKSHRHLCLQTLLIILLVIFLITFASVFLLNLGTYILTSSAKMIQDDQSMNPSSSQPNDQILLIDPSTNMTVDVPAPLQDDTNEQEPNEVVLADWLADKIRYSNCSFLSSTVQSGQMLELCDANVDPFSTDKAYMQCFRTSILYSGLASLLPFVLILLSIIAVCRLLLCPILTLAIVYLLLSIALVVGAILFNSGTIVNNLETDDSLPPLFHVILFLVVLYTIFSLLHILLFALVTCERRRNRNGDSEKIMKQSTDDEDDIDDPKAPLYENGFSPQKKNDFEEKIKDLKFIDDDMSYILRKG